MNIYIYLILFNFIYFNSLNADNSLDCTKFDLEVGDYSNKILTKEEEIELMDKELYKSLSKFERCTVKNSNSSSSSSNLDGSTSNDRKGENSENTSNLDNSESRLDLSSTSDVPTDTEYSKITASKFLTSERKSLFSSLSVSILSVPPVQEIIRNNPNTTPNNFADISN